MTILLKHKLPVPAMAQAFPWAQLWVTPGQWSFPLSLPPSWLGFPPGQTMSGAQSVQEKAPNSIGPAATWICALELERLQGDEQCLDLIFRPSASN